MYFEIDDNRPDIYPVGRAISWREGILISIIAHMAVVIFILLLPKLFPYDEAAARARAALLQQRAQAEPPRFVFVQPRIDRAAPKPPLRADESDKDRMARAPERAPNPTNPLPFSRGNTPERVEESPRQLPAGRGPAPEPSAGQKTQQPEHSAESEVKAPDSKSRLQVPAARPVNPSGLEGRSATSGGALGDALRNLQRYVQREQFDNPGGGGGQFGPEIQFDTKGVEFGPWIRRFIAQVKRNWFIPYAAMSMKGHVVITFNVHKDGTLTDLSVVGPSTIDSFNNAAYGALSASNPTQPLPPEYPADKAFFTVTFFYNETPP
jgi:TonB family protein